MGSNGPFAAMRQEHEARKKSGREGGEAHAVPAETRAGSSPSRAAEPQVRAESKSDLQAEIDRITAAGRSGAEPLLDRMVRRFGYGADRSKRLTFYRRVQTIVEAYGPCAYQLVQEAAAQAVSARSPGNYFCKAVSIKLREAGYFVGGGEGVADVL